jgi:type VI secretion system protein ImpA
LVEQYWGGLYPLLDPEDNNDPTYRLNLLAALTAPRGSVTGWLAILDNLYVAPVCQPKGAPPVTFEQLQAAKSQQAPVEGAPSAPSLSQLVPALRACADQVAAHYQALKESLETAQAMDQFLANTLTAHKSMSFDELFKVLKEMLTSLEPYLPGEEGQAAAEAAGNGHGAEPAEAGAAIHVHGPIRTRTDAVAALENICQYYQQVEPGSPVPYLLRRAQKLATMNFVQAVQELNLVAGLDALRPSMGSVVDGQATNPEAPAS